MQKAVNNQLKKQKINEDRLNLAQEISYLFRPLAICPFPARGLPKIKIIRTKMGIEVEEKAYETKWERKNGNIRVEITANEKYGVPYGQDILVILYLAREATKQKRRDLKINFYRDFCRMFEINANDGRQYRKVQTSLQRIRHSQFSWIDESDPKRERESHYLYIDDIDIYFDPKNPDQKPVWGEQTIKISERFWNEIMTHKIPFNVESVRYLKGKSAHLNFYIWLSYRVWKAWNDKLNGAGNGTVFIPFWGKVGLQNQLSSQISRRNDYRKEVKKWFSAVQEIWTDCPVEIDGDALRIHITDASQLDVQEGIESSGKRLRKARQAKAIERAKSPIAEFEYCDCGELMKPKRGKPNRNGITQSDYWQCETCNTIKPMSAFCISCFRKTGKVYPLRQDYGTGEYRCPSCKGTFPVESYWEANRLW